MSGSGFVPMYSTRAPAARIFATTLLNRENVVATLAPYAKSFSPQTNTTQSGLCVLSWPSMLLSTFLHVQPPTPTLVDPGNLLLVDQPSMSESPVNMTVPWIDAAGDGLGGEGGDGLLLSPILVPSPTPLPPALTHHGLAPALAAPEP